MSKKVYPVGEFNNYEKMAKGLVKRFKRIFTSQSIYTSTNTK